MVSSFRSPSEECSMIQQLREQSQSIFFKILLGFIAITFVISFGVGSFFGSRKEVIALVNSKELLLQEFQRTYSQQIENLRARFGTNADQLAEQINLRQQVLQQLINRYLLADEAEKQGIRLTDFELQDYIKNQPYFQIDGHFDFNTYEQILRQNRMLVEEYEAELRVDLLASKYQDMLLSGLVVSDAEVDRIYHNENETITVEYLYFDPLLFMDQVEMDDDELQKYYEDHPDEFEQPKRFKIEYFLLTLDQFKETAVAKEREIVRYYERNREEYTTPVAVKARHILIKADMEMAADEKAQKRQQAENILKQLQQGAVFEELARAYSEDFSKEQGGDLGWFEPGEMAAGFEEVAFNLQPGELSAVVETLFGFHIIRVDEKKEESVQTLEDVRAEIEDLLRESRAQKKLDLEYQRLLSRMEEEKDLAAIAESFGTSVAQTEFFDREDSVEKLGSLDVLADQLQSQQVGDYGRLQRNPIQGYVFYELLDVQEPSTKPFEEVETEVARLVEQQKAVDLASDIGQKESTALTDGKSLESIAASYGLELGETTLTAVSDVISGIGYDPVFKKNVLALNDSRKVSGSLYQEKYYLIELKNRQLAEDENIDAKKQEIRQRLIAQIRQAFVDKDMQRLRDAASIEILNPFFRSDAPES